MYRNAAAGGIENGEFEIEMRFLATPVGFEPTISTVTGWHVRPLHHGAEVW
jgi:hypothetical protein